MRKRRQTILSRGPNNPPPAQPTDLQILLLTRKSSKAYLLPRVVCHRFGRQYLLIIHYEPEKREKREGSYA